MCGASIEAILKLELEKEGINTEDKGINYMNNCALERNIITEKEWNCINVVRKARNEIVHLKYSNLKYARDFAYLLCGDIFGSSTHQIIEKKMLKKIRNVIDKTQKVIEYFSDKY